MSKDQFNIASAADTLLMGGYHDSPRSETTSDELAPRSAAGNKEAERFSPEALMHKNRIVIIAGEVDQKLADKTIVYIKHLEALDPAKPITLLINSPGGSVLAGLAIVDTVRQCKCKIITIGSGMQASMGWDLMASGDERYMQPNAKLMIHQTLGGARGQASDIEIEMAFMTQLNEESKDYYVEHIGLIHAYWDLIMERDTWFSAEQAKAIGLIHGVTEAQKPGGRYAADAKRATEDSSKRLSEIAQMTAKEVVNALGTGQGNESRWGRYRPQLAVRLAEFPEYWTQSRKAEAKAAAKASNASNDDTSKPAKARKAVSGPDV